MARGKRNTRIPKSTTAEIGGFMKYIIKAAGPFACFRRPEFSAERISYDVITPSAARGIFESVYWQHSMRWVIDRILVMKPIKHFEFKRNEVSKMISVSEVLNHFGSKKPSGPCPGLITTENREQRFNLILKDVEYVLEAHIESVFSDPQASRHPIIFERRIAKGQCYRNPHMGTSEYPADIVRLDKFPKSPLKGIVDLGLMLYGIDYMRDHRPLMFHATMVNGVINVPHHSSKEVLG